MAESVLISFVIGILEDMITNEVQLLGEVVDQVKSVQSELKNIKCYLRDADSKRCKGSASVENWLNNLRAVAHPIEDAIDTFHLLLEDKHQKDSSFFDKLKNLSRMPMKVPGLHKLARELADIENKLKKIFDAKDRYDIKPLQDEGNTSGTVILPHRRAAHEDVDETQVVGLDADKNNILKLLQRQATPRRAVITIVGTGGLGKTTLARMVYKSVKAKFSFHIMLSVSQQYNLTYLVRKILRELKGSVPENQDLGDLTGELKSLLQWRRYLIILDDVWETDLWDKLKNILPDNVYGSRVLMTSRSIDIAKLADPGMVPYNLDFLNDKDSLNLLLKKALPYKKCPNDLHKLAETVLSKKCKGLPLALIVVGGILSTKYQNYHDWKRVSDTMNWYQEGIDCMKVLALSYEDMPDYLKACFLYLGAFPEDYKISAKRLIRMWVAEWFMSWQETKTMEQAAEDCLEQLFQRSMIQVSSRHTNGSIKHCQVHDLLRDLAIHQARKENFLTVFRKLENANHDDGATRRASLQLCSTQFMEDVRPTNTRLLLWFGGRNNLPNYYELRLLRVVEIVDVKMSRITDLRGLDRLIHLRYLGFQNCTQLNMPTCSFDRLKNLETLDLRGTSMQQLPKGLWTISTLRHVLYDPYIRGLPSTAKLRNLQTLQWVEINSTWLPNQFPHLNDLRKLGLTRRDANWLAVTYLLRTLSSLISLGIKGSDIPKEIIYPQGIPKYQDMQTLHLEGRWAQSATLAAKSFPRHLVKLTLIGSKLAHDPMLELAKIKSLKKLRLGRDAYTGKQMNCPSGFRALQTLVLGVCEYMVLTVAEGAMPKLKCLKCVCCIKLVLPPELNHLIGNEYIFTIDPVK